VPYPVACMVVFVEGKKYTIREPLPVTLKKYGLSLNEWKNILAEQGYRCPICKRVPSSGMFRTDHLHVQNYKKMSPEKKKLWVRGLPCVHCNRFFLAKGITVEKAQAVVDYLKAFEKRRPK
jgi:hypothetical protein